MLLRENVLTGINCSLHEYAEINNRRLNNKIRSNEFFKDHISRLNIIFSKAAEWRHLYLNTLQKFSGFSSRNVSNLQKLFSTFLLKKILGLKTNPHNLIYRGDTCWKTPTVICLSWHWHLVSTKFKRAENLRTKVKIKKYTPFECSYCFCWGYMQYVGFF